MEMMNGWRDTARMIRDSWTTCAVSLMSKIFALSITFTATATCEDVVRSEASALSPSTRSGVAGPPPGGGGAGSLLLHALYTDPVRPTPSCLAKTSRSRGEDSPGFSNEFRAASNEPRRCASSNSSRVIPIASGVAAYARDVADPAELLPGRIRLADSAPGPVGVRGAPASARARKSAELCDRGGDLDNASERGAGDVGRAGVPGERPPVPAPAAPTGDPPEERARSAGDSPNARPSPATCFMPPRPKSSMDGARLSPGFLALENPPTRSPTTSAPSRRSAEASASAAAFSVTSATDALSVDFSDELRRVPTTPGVPIDSAELSWRSRSSLFRRSSLAAFSFFDGAPIARLIRLEKDLKLAMKLERCFFFASSEGKTLAPASSPARRTPSPADIGGGGFSPAPPPWTDAEASASPDDSSGGFEGELFDALIASGAPAIQSAPASPVAKSPARLTRPLAGRLSVGVAGQFG